MSTDDSISEDVSSSAALSHHHADADASAGKESEASIISSEDIPAGPEEEPDPVRSVRTLQGFLQATAGAVRSRSPPTPASSSSHKSSPEEFSSGRNLPSINPSPLETLTALVQEIQKSGETDPELWKDSEGRWLQLFKLVEKQYQQQILAQQDQYQRQIQLIQDEIKALVQLQNRAGTTQPSDDSPAQTPRESPLSDPTPPLPSPSATPTADPGGPCREGVGPGSSRGDEGQSPSPPPPACSTTAPPLVELQRMLFSPTPPDSLLSPLSPPADQSQTSSPPLTTWAQRRRRRPALGQQREACGEARAVRSAAEIPQTRADPLENYWSLAQSAQPVHLKHSDSQVAPGTGLAYWKLDDKELFHPLPDSLTSVSFPLQQEASAYPVSPDEVRLSVSLRKIYQSSAFSSSAPVTQVRAVHAGSCVRQPRRTPSFTSTFRFSSPPFPTQSQPLPLGGAPKDTSLAASSIGTFCRRSDSMAAASPASSPSDGQDPCGGTNGRPYCMEEPSPAQLPAPPRPDPWLTTPARACLDTTAAVEDPVLLSLARQSMREKTSRHIADLRAYYEAEISSLKEQLALAKQPPSSDMKAANQILKDRCSELERKVAETRARTKELEEHNLLLEKQLTERQERYDTAVATVTALQRQLEESKQSEREKEAAAEQLRARLQQLEQAYRHAYRASDDRDAQSQREHRMLQDDKLVSAEDRLFDARAEISELKRTVCKMESQVKQLEHENLKMRHLSRSHSQPSGASLHHPPDWLLAPSKSAADLGPSCREGPHTGQPSDLPAPSTTRHHSPPEGEGPQGPLIAEEPPRREALLAPAIKSLIQLEETRATEGRALQRPDSQGSRTSQSHSGAASVSVSGCSGWELGPERGGSLARACRSLSPDGPRSSSLPPCSRSVPNATPLAKRDRLVAPLSAKSSPKRCPSENYSTAFGPSRPWQCSTHTWFDVRLDQRGLMSSSPSHSSNAKKKLQVSEANHQPSNGGRGGSSGTEPMKRAMELSCEEQGAEGSEAERAWPSDTPLSYQERLHSLADMERLFDGLTREKQQIEAAPSPTWLNLLSRANTHEPRDPGTGGRVTLQAKLDEEALEERLENINRELGSIRMTLKKFHILRSSANI
ncbi:hypothetical protein AGOR_G00057590 [Albula goreensis]|uniref:M-phase phosphoprotein 9 n=1 Tax=Albula goreensis TaxID=1534307 RepID=A0A8T3DZ19_9TELE|nr:hypothetical protein AGOR_G00057590 [Albula goreensis]